MPSSTLGLRITFFQGGGGGNPTQSRKPDCLDAALEAEPLPAPNPITYIREWIHQLQTHTHEDFASLALLHKDHTCLPYMDVSGVALLRPSQMHHCVYGEWQGTL